MSELQLPNDAAEDEYELVADDDCDEVVEIDHCDGRGRSMTTAVDSVATKRADCQRGYRGTPASWLLPLPRTRTSQPNALVEAPSLSSNPVAAAAAASPPVTAEPDGQIMTRESSSNLNEQRTTDESPTSPSPTDRIGAYFGYNGVDALVPKPAYDASMQRIRTLESNLGAANREIRAQSTTISDLKGSIQSLQRQLSQKDSLLQQLTGLEAALAARERELDAREEALTQLAKQQRRMSGKSHQSIHAGVDAENQGNHSGVGHATVMMSPVDGMGGVNGRSRGRIGVDRREEEAYALWVSSGGVGLASGYRVASRSSAATEHALLASSNLPRVMGAGRVRMAPSAYLPPRSQTSLGTLPTS